MYQLKKNINVITLEAEISGRLGIRTIKMALDTGATYVMLPWEYAEILGYEPNLSTKKISIITASGIERALLITLNSITVLGKKAENVSAVIHDLPQESYVNGLLGLSYLKNFDTCLYFKKEILEIS